jgi:hypothetical protein
MQQRPENVLGGLSNSGPVVRLYREGRATGPPEVTTQYFGCCSYRTENTPKAKD